MKIFYRSLPSGLRRSSLVVALLVGVFIEPLGLGLSLSLIVFLCVYGGFYMLTRRETPKRAISKGGKLHTDVKLLLDQVTDRSIEWFLWEAEIRSIAKDIVTLTYLVVVVVLFVNLKPENAWLLFIGVSIITFICFRFVANFSSSILIEDDEKEAFLSILKADHPNWIVTDA